MKYYVVFNEGDEMRIASADKQEHAINVASELKGIMFSASGFVKFFLPKQIKEIIGENKSNNDNVGS